jgi:GTP-binding protein
MTAPKPGAVRVLHSDFVTSATGLPGAPREGLPEVAFLGRSNVGKSTLINKLTGRRQLARVSRTPGRTRLLNFFRLQIALGPKGREQPMDLSFCDLPGYGYAKIAKDDQAKWRDMIESYLKGRDDLRVAVILLDIRRDPSELDTGLMEWLGALGRRILPVVTKADKFARNRRRHAIQTLERQLGIPAGQALAVSAISGEGCDELWAALVALCQ